MLESQSSAGSPQATGAGHASAASAPPASEATPSVALASPVAASFASESAWQPVEGYSSFLWAALLLLVWNVTGVTPPVSANPLALVCGLLTLVLVARRLHSMALPDPLAGRRAALSTLVLVAIASSHSWITWQSSGLDAALFGMLVALVFAAPPLMRARHYPAMALMRSRVAPLARAWRGAVWPVALGLAATMLVFGLASGLVLGLAGGYLWARWGAPSVPGGSGPASGPVTTRADRVPAGPPSAAHAGDPRGPSRSGSSW